MLLNEEYLRKVVRESIHSVLMENEQPDWFLEFGFDENFDFANDMMNNCQFWDINEENGEIYIVLVPNDDNLEYYYIVYVDCEIEWENDGMEDGCRIVTGTPYITNINSVRIDSDIPNAQETEIEVNKSDEFIEFLEKVIKESGFYSEEDLYQCNPEEWYHEDDAYDRWKEDGF